MDQASTSMTAGQAVAGRIPDRAAQALPGEASTPGASHARERTVPLAQTAASQPALDAEPEIDGPEGQAVTSRVPDRAGLTSPG